MSNVIVLKAENNREIVIIKGSIQYIEFLESDRCGYIYFSNNVVTKISKEQYDKIKEMLME